MFALVFWFYLLYTWMASNAPLEVRIQTAIEALPSAHRLPPTNGEVVDSLDSLTPIAKI